MAAAVVRQVIASRAAAIPTAIANGVSNGYTAVLLGGTGAVGSEVLKTFLDSPHCTSVTTLARRKIDWVENNPKVKHINIDVEGLVNLSQFSESPDLSVIEEKLTPAAVSILKACRQHDVAVCTLGVGQPSKTTKEEFFKVDVNMATGFAVACRAANISHISLLTAAGTDKSSLSYYVSAKGIVEENYTKLGFDRTSFIRPSLIVTPNIRYGMQDRLTQFWFPKISWMMPNKYHEIHVEDLGKAFVKNIEAMPQSQNEKVIEFVEYDLMMKLVQPKS